MSDCIFCKIAGGEIPNYTVYEDDYVLAFLDIHPCAKGHAVVIPKKHYADISEMGAAEWGFLSAGLMAAARKVYQALSPDGMNVGLNDKPAAGQAVPHLHWHIIPRYTGDGGGSMHSIVRSGGADAASVAELFQIQNA